MPSANSRASPRPSPLRPDPAVRTDSRPAPGFPDEAPGLLFAVKDGHFWFTHRRLAIREAARSCLPGAPRARVLDLGCGDGEILAELSDILMPSGSTRESTTSLWRGGAAPLD